MQLNLNDSLSTTAEFQLFPRTIQFKGVIPETPIFIKDVNVLRQ
jgi:hypothetical protein